jgi:hypothetical protein
VAIRIGILSDAHMPAAVREIWPELVETEYEFDGTEVHRLGDYRGSSAAEMRPNAVPWSSVQATLK